MPRDRRFGRCRDCIAWNVIPHEWNGKSPCFAHPPTVLFERAYWKQRPLIARGTPDEEASAVAWRRVAPPDCTGSIDAAMTMKPPRWRLASLQEEPPEIGGWRATGHRASPGVAIEGAAAKTASLTVTALWLRALAADLEGTDAATV